MVQSIVPFAFVNFIHILLALGFIVDSHSDIDIVYYSFKLFRIQKFLSSYAMAYFISILFFSKIQYQMFSSVLMSFPNE